MAFVLPYEADSSPKKGEGFDAEDNWRMYLDESNWGIPSYEGNEDDQTSSYLEEEETEVERIDESEYLDIFIDLDETLLSNDLRSFNVHGLEYYSESIFYSDSTRKFYRLHPHAFLFLESLKNLEIFLKDTPYTLRISFFSNHVSPGRNLDVLKQVMLSPDESAFDLAEGRVFSIHDAIHLVGMETKSSLEYSLQELLKQEGTDSSHYGFPKKDLTLLPGITVDPSRAILIDDANSNSVSGQEDSMLLFQEGRKNDLVRIRGLLDVVVERSVSGSKSFAAQLAHQLSLKRKFNYELRGIEVLKGLDPTFLLEGESVPKAFLAPFDFFDDSEDFQSNMDAANRLLSGSRFHVDWSLNKYGKVTPVPRKKEVSCPSQNWTTKEIIGLRNSLSGIAGNHDIQKLRPMLRMILKKRGSGFSKSIQKEDVLVSAEGRILQVESSGRKGSKNKVYKVKDLSTGKIFALKVSKGSKKDYKYSWRETESADFIDEAKHLHFLNNQAIRSTEAEEGEASFLLTKWVEGITAREFLFYKNLKLKGYRKKIQSSLADFIRHLATSGVILEELSSNDLIWDGVDWVLVDAAKLKTSNKKERKIRNDYAKMVLNSWMDKKRFTFACGSLLRQIRK